MTCPGKSSPTDHRESAADCAQQFWRSLEELAGDPEFEQRLGREFERHASVWDPDTDRRRFIQLMAASMALGGMSGCSSPPPEPILPYVRTPAGLTPGVAMHFATAIPNSTGALGVVVTSHMGRPTKIEGNALHPASLGATDAQAQASVLTLYDPDRSQTVKRLGDISTWDALLSFVREATAGMGDGAGLRVLSPPINSPTLLRQRLAFLDKFPSARWHEYEPARTAHGREGARIAFGEAASAIYHFADAEVVVSLDSNFLAEGPGAVRYARDFMSRRGGSGEGVGNRLYMIESSFTPTGAAADHRLAIGPSKVGQFALQLAATLGVGDAPASEATRRWVDAVARDLERHRGRCVVLAGEQQPAAVHAAAHAINDVLENAGATVTFINSIAPSPEDDASLRDLTAALAARQVELLIVLDANPAYDAPTELDFSSLIREARTAIHFGLYEDETAALCQWHIPAAHFLESWGDARAYDGTASIVQPLIEPLYGGKTPHDVLAAFVEQQPRSTYEQVRSTWRGVFADGFDALWHESLRNGFVPDSVFQPRTLALRLDAIEGALQAISRESGNDTTSEETDERVFEVALLPDPSVGDGRFANNGWLQELPKPLTKLTWDNAILMAPRDARALGLSTGDIITLNQGDRDVRGPVCLVPGHPAGSLTCHFGYGRSRAGQTGTGLGFNAYRMLTSGGGPLISEVRLTKTGQRVSLAITQKHHAIDGRNIVHSSTLEAFKKDPASSLPESAHHDLPSLYPKEKYEGFAWGMAIDLSKCTGCNACVVACQAENNVPVVGKDQVLRGREMHWLRMDLYFSGSPNEPQAIHQPMLCQHCEKAPCEVVCPVAATTHSDEGLNEMTYNRCIGTRYCSNNCPYKVRRFNFFQFQDETTPVLKLLRNPDVTVRSRGIMEKCTYCVQRIDRARIEAKKTAVDAGRPATIEDGSLQSACQQACPTQAFVFGDVNDPQSRVSRMKADARNYGVLSELGTSPRTTYLVHLRNPNPELD